MKYIALTAALALTTASHPIFACGTDGSHQQLPEPVKESAVTLERVGETMRLDFSGKLASSVFLHLSARDLQTRKENGKVIKDAVGIRCEFEKDQYRCSQIFDVNGDSAVGLPGLFPEDAPPYITLEYKGQSAESLFNGLNAPAGIKEGLDGEQITRKVGVRISCDKINKAEKVNFLCTQYMINNGFSWGDGMDPIVSVGTHSLVMEISDDGFVQKPVVNVSDIGGISTPVMNLGGKR